MTAVNEKPTPPANFECCESECSPCVWDTYFEELRLWKEAQEKLTAEKEGSSDDK